MARVKLSEVVRNTKRVVAAAATFPVLRGGGGLFVKVPNLNQVVHVVP